MNWIVQQADLVLEKQAFGTWIKIPCVDDFGSCTYPDLCNNLSTITCPLPFVQQKVPCKCPFRKVRQPWRLHLSLKNNVNKFVDSCRLWVLGVFILLLSV